jgi:protoheme ferro-lyase
MTDYSAFQMFAGPYKITPSAYQFMHDWIQSRGGPFPPHLEMEADAVDAYFALPIHERDIMHNQMMANLWMTRDELTKTRQACIMAETHMRGLPKEYLEFSGTYLRELERTIQNLERDLEDERTWVSYY